MEEIKKVNKSDIKKHILNRIEEIENGSIEYLNNQIKGMTYSPKGHQYWNVGYIEVLKELNKLLEYIK